MEDLKGQIDDLPGLRDKQKEYLRSIMGPSRAQLEEGETSELAGTLDKLMVVSRVWGPPEVTEKLTAASREFGIGGVRIPKPTVHYDVVVVRPGFAGAIRETVGTYRSLSDAEAAKRRWKSRVEFASVEIVPRIRTR